MALDLVRLFRVQIYNRRGGEDKDSVRWALADAEDHTIYRIAGHTIQNSGSYHTE